MENRANATVLVRHTVLTPRLVFVEVPEGGRVALRATELEVARPSGGFDPGDLDL